MRYRIIMILFVLLNLLAVQDLAACCMGDYVGVYPRGSKIMQNPVFLVDYKEADFKLANKLDKLEFYLLVNNKREVPVAIEKKVIGTGSLSQLLLKPNGLLELNDSVQLQLRFKHTKPQSVGEEFMLIDKQLELFQGIINNHKWLVGLAQDMERPKWFGNLTWI